ncbi:MAG: aldehyde ferredoxin oxidoreductase C-terminal domain-containing protein [Candidatus Bathyarchaeia archaeon]
MNSGRILKIDLARKKKIVETLNREYIKEFIGGLGLGVKLADEYIPPTIDPYDPDNVLIITTSPTSGLPIPSGWEYTFVSKSPLTGGIAVSICHGMFAGHMKRAGYDAIVIKGTSEKPIYLLVDDEDITFNDARDFWGKSPRRTEEAIKKDLGDYSISVATIGLSGEMLAKISCILTNQVQVSGKMGLGAVLGSKNLKAIAIRGSHSAEAWDVQRLEIFCEEALLTTRGSTAVRCYKEDFLTEKVIVKDRILTTIFEPAVKYRDPGVISDLLVLNELGVLPARNFTSGVFESADEIYKDLKKLAKKAHACSPCSMGCQHLINSDDTSIYLDYVSVWAFGPNCGIKSADTILKAIALCNYFGMDPVSVGNIVGFSMECYEKEIIDYASTGGLHLKFGNEKDMLELIQKIGERKDIGNLLAEGVKAAAQGIGKNAEKLAVHIKGVELAGYDLRGLKTAALSFAVSFRDAYYDGQGAYLFDIKGISDRFSAGKGKGRLVKDLEDFLTILNSIGICTSFASVYELKELAELYNIITGINISPQELRICGEKINDLARIFNFNAGIKRNDDIPVKFIENPIPEGPSKGCILTPDEMQILLKDYYEERCWTEGGLPRRYKSI